MHIRSPYCRVLCIAACLGPVLAGAGAGDVPSEPPLPIVARGDINFHVDGAVLGSPGELFLYLSVPMQEVRCDSIAGREGLWARLNTRLTLQDQVGRTVRQIDYPIDLGAPAAGPRAELRPLLVRMRAPLTAGTTAFMVELEDQRATRQGHIHQVTTTAKRGRASGSLPTAETAEGLCLGGPIFLWDSPRADSLEVQGGYRCAPAGRLRELIDPHPTRIYGIFNPHVTLYLEAYGKPGQAVRLVLQVESQADRRQLLEQTTHLRLPGPRTAFTRQLDISKLPAGSYRLRFLAYSGEKRTVAPPARVERTFKVMWDAASWTKTPEQLREEAALVLQEDEWEDYCRLPPGDQEAYLNAFWHSLDGYAVGADGRAPRAVFRERLATARERYGLRRDGRLNDRGRVYVRYGDPDEVVKELHPQDENLLFYFLEREIDDREMVIDGGRPRRHPMDMSAYEVWRYMNRGAPLSPAWAARTREQSLRLIFVNEMGLGNHRLIFSNVQGGTL